MPRRPFRRVGDEAYAPSRVRRWMRETRLDHDLRAARLVASVLAWALVLRARLREIVVETDPSNAELGMSGLTFSLGLDLLAVPHVFAMSPAYNGLSYFATEPWWGVSLVAVGVLQFTGCVFEQVRTRTVAHLAGLWFWVFVSYGFAAESIRHGVYGGWTSVLFPLFAAANLWLFARVPAVRWRRPTPPTTPPTTPPDDPPDAHGGGAVTAAPRRE